ncbi:MAG TPA: heme-dependent oxidative N-demethylase subunit alpha family protein [Bdellovibrionales bacterium]|nr:heme-dependent oxidative N-demethylase subunit alpha family protein [Bdellovibrionales bacterium]
MLLERTPAVYFPIERGLYEIGPGFKPFGFDFGNGDADGKVFQIDREFARFRQEKEDARAENLSKYFGVERLSPEALKAAVDFILDKATSEYPDLFELRTIDESKVLHCRLTGETLRFSKAGELIDVKRQKSSVPYRHAFDALVSQFQEDAAIISVDDNENWMSAMHISGPSHWDPREKLGRDFIAVHKPIPGFDKVARAHQQIVDAMVNKGPFVRFVWSFVTDTRINHHPEPAPGIDPALWKGRSFQERDDGQAPFHLRVERQLTFGMPEVKSSLFLIRLSFIDGNELKANPLWRTQLVSALKSMTPESRVYKGVAGCFDQLVSWLERS